MPERYFLRDEEERHPTGLRFSLANEQLGTEDYFINHPTRPRIVSYSKPDAARLAIRDTLRSHNLILGRTARDGDSLDKEYVVIPGSARPVSYDAQTYATGFYTYTDNEIFFDMGKLLGKFTAVTEQKMMIEGELGRLVAIVEFTKQGEQKLSFVPGIELAVNESQDSPTILETYADNLSEEFAPRFTGVVDQFCEGYKRVLEKN